MEDDPIMVDSMLQFYLIVFMITIYMYRRLSTSCLAAARKFFCANGYVMGQKKFVYEVLQENKVSSMLLAALAANKPSLYYDSLYLPRYANYTVCESKSCLLHFVSVTQICFFAYRLCTRMPRIH